MRLLSCGAFVCAIYFLVLPFGGKAQDGKKEAQVEAKPLVAEVGQFFTNTIGIKLTYIPPGVFTMGSPKREANRLDDEGPAHIVEITQGFHMGVHEVTQAQYKRVMGKNNPSYFKEDDLPVEQLAWNEAQDFCRKLSQLEGKTYRLPTEAQWEYACRAGTKTAFHFGNTLSATLANFDGKYPYGAAAKGPFLAKTSKVGSYPPNAWGLHDMHGNVWEWCADWYDKDYYKASPPKDPQGPETGSYRVLRGGSWYSFARTCRSATRYQYKANDRDSFVGFRVVLSKGP